MKFLKSLKLIDSNWVANLALWGILFTPLFFVFDFRHFPNFGKGLWFFSVCSIFIAAAFFTIDWSRIKVWFKHPLVWVLSSWFFIIVLSTIFSINSYVSFWGNPERLGGLITAIYIFVFLITLLAHLQKDNAMRILAVVALVGGIVGLHVIGQKLGLDPTWASFKRPIATFGNPIFLSTFLMLTVFMALYFALQSRKLWLKILYGISFIVQIAALFMAVSRGPVIGLIFGLGIFVVGFLWIKYADQKIKFWRILGATALAGVMLIGGLYFAREPLSIQRLFDYSILKQGTTHSRLVIMQSTYQGAQDRPWLGFGPENIYVAYNRYYKPVLAESGYQETFSDRAHSVVVDQLASNGWLGLMVMLAFIVGLIFYGIKWIKRASGQQQKVLALVFTVIITAYFIQDLVEFDVITNYVYGAILVAMFLCLSAPANAMLSSYRSRWLNWVGGILLAGLSFYLIFGIYLPSWRGGILTKQAYEASVYARDYSQANDYYNAAFKIESPWAHWYLYKDYSPFVANLANEAYKNNPTIASFILDDSIKRMEKFIKREPENIQARFNHAGLNVFLDDMLPGRREGDKLFKQLLAEHPNREFFYLAWGKNLYLSRRVEEAKEKVLRSMGVASVPIEAHFWLGVIEATLGNEEAALYSLHQAAIRPTGQIASEYQNQLEFVVSYLLERGRYHDAIPLQKRLTEINPKELQYWLNLAVLCRDTGQTKLAEQTARRILELFPDTREDVLDFINSL